MKKVILGTMQFYWTSTKEQAIQVLDSYYQLGGRDIDTADMYPNWVSGFKGGETENLVGEWMKSKKRSEIYLTSKVRGKLWEGNDGEGLSKKHIIKAIDLSLKRLQTDYLDLYLAHFPDEQTQVEETLQTFKELIKSGKIKEVGFSNYSPTDLEQILTLAKILGLEIKQIQVYYNLIDRQNFEDNFLPLVKEFNIQVSTFGSLANGFLSGAYRKNQEIPDHDRAKFVKEKMTGKNFTILKALDDLAIKYQKTVGQISLNWLLNKNHVLGAIVGADKKSQIVENYQALDFELEKQDILLLDEVSSAR